MRVIALDPSLRSFGVYSVRDGEASSMVIQKKGDRVETLGRLLSKFSHISAEGWDLAIVEDYAMGQQGTAVTSQAEVGGIARGIFSARSIPVIEVPIPVWKAVTGIRMKKGTAMHKSDYINAVLKVFGVLFETTDECDAFLLYQTVKKCGIGPVVGSGAIKIKQRLELLKIKAEEM